MRIILDVMGADLSARELALGAVAAKAEYQTDITLVGDSGIIKEALAEAGVSEELFTIIHTDDVVTMEDDPTSVLRVHKNSSMATALRLLATGEGDAVVSAGNTGALFTAASLTVRRIPGVRRAALATVLPMEKPMLLLDCGANVAVTPEYLLQFAVIGSIYAEKLLHITSPRVGLLNNGTEEHKGTPTVSEAYALLSKAEGINFVGNIEGKAVPFGACDVLVCDGFTGNILLKTIEGLSRFLLGTVSAMFHESFTSKIAGLMVKKKAKRMKKRFDAKEYGGAPFLGLAKPVIKAHGSSDAKAIQSAIRQAIAYAQTGVIGEIESRLGGNSGSEQS